MKTKIWLAAIALSLGLFVVSCNKDDKNTNTTPKLNQTDIDFLNNLTQGNLAQIRVNQLARDSGTDSQLSNYASTLIQGYQNAQKTLDSIATRYSITLPTQGDTTSIAYYNNLSTTARGMGFDSSFIANQIQVLDAELSRLNMASSQAQNSTLKNYSINQLPLTTQYRAQADSIRQHF